MFARVLSQHGHSLFLCLLPGNSSCPTKVIAHAQVREVAPNHNLGFAPTATHVTSWSGSSELCFRTTPSGSPKAAVFHTRTNSTGSKFFAQGNITFANGDAVLIVASDNGVAFAEQSLSYGAVPYKITGGSGAFKGESTAHEQIRTSIKIELMAVLCVVYQIALISAFCGWFCSRLAVLFVCLFFISFSLSHPSLMVRLP